MYKYIYLLGTVSPNIDRYKTFFKRISIIMFNIFNELLLPEYKFQSLDQKRFLSDWISTKIWL